MEAVQEAPEALQIGTVIQGIITVNDERYVVEITVGANPPSFTAEEHLSFVQSQVAQQGQDADLESEIDGVEVINVSTPEKIEAWKVAQGTHYKVVGKVVTEPEVKPEDKTKEGVKTRGMFGRLLGRFGL